MSETPPPPPSPLGGFTAGPTDVAAPASKDDNNMGLLLFILCIVTGFIGPLIVWLLKKESSRYIDSQGKEILNWCITMFCAGVVCGILTLVVIGIFLIPVLILCNLIFNIMGILAATKGQFYRYPFALRLLK
jgi:uncharacterized Tic20 family protein